uniref:uncharacterized protein LOC131137437 isoform X2 n=1 Tax=Doryrhamphus excisus TaxID=161450 RepID=UPI0025AEB88D|nr:uncharacterized protein LOC131137437 isoform X2 [Doryrhamphus excisus]
MRKMLTGPLSVNPQVSECTVCQAAQHTIKQNVRYTPIKRRATRGAVLVSSIASPKQNPKEQHKGVAKEKGKQQKMSPRTPDQVTQPFELMDSGVEDYIGAETVCEDIRRLDEIRDIVLKNVSRSQQRTMQEISLKRKQVSFAAGDRVWRQNVRSQQRKGGKLESNFLGPFTITTIHGKSADLIGDNGVDYKKISMTT